MTSDADDQINSETKENKKKVKESDHDKLFRLVSSVVQWYLVLDQIRSERASEPYFSSGRENCQCPKAKEIIEKCRNVKAELDLIIEKIDGKDVQTEKPEFLKKTAKHIDLLGSILHSNISIQIPASMNSSQGELKEKACSLVMEGDVQNMINEAMEGVILSIEELFNMSKCGHETAEEVAKLPSMNPGSLFIARKSGPPRGIRRKAEDDGNTQKPKRFRAARKSIEETEGVRKFKPQASPEVLHMLEKKKKLVKKNGLLQFVLWREAYRSERDRNSEMETRSARKFMAMARRRRSPFQSVKDKV